jgi:hypothetical protein
VGCCEVQFNDVSDPLYLGCADACQRAYNTLVECNCSGIHCIYANADGTLYDKGTVEFTTCRDSADSATFDLIGACEQGFGAGGFNNTAFNPDDCQATSIECSTGGEISNVRTRDL